jgi:hypothetical protein
VINVRPTYELLRRGVWTTCAFHLCTGHEWHSPRLQPCGGHWAPSQSPAFLVCTQADGLFAQVIHRLVHSRKADVLLAGLAGSSGPPTGKAAHPGCDDQGPRVGRSRSRALPRGRSGLLAALPRLRDGARQPQEHGSHHGCRPRCAPPVRSSSRARATGSTVIPSFARRAQRRVRIHWYTRSNAPFRG